MDKELLKEKYLQQGYDEKYFEYFFNFYWAEFDDNEDESLSFQTSCQFMEVFKSQLALGHSEEWANNYACLKFYSLDFDITNDSLVGEMLESVQDKRHDLEIFVKDFNMDENFNYAYVESWIHEILSAPEYMDNYTFAIECSQNHKELLTNLRRANEHAHILECIQLAFNNRNEIIAIISSSETSADAQLKLEAHYHINNDQSRVIVDMRFSSLTQQSINAIKDEYNEILEQISQLSQNISLNL
jgi:hypothetical protein